MYNTSLGKQSYFTTNNIFEYKKKPIKPSPSQVFSITHKNYSHLCPMLL